MKKKAKQALLKKFPQLDDAIAEVVASRLAQQAGSETELPELVEGMGPGELALAYAEGLAAQNPASPGSPLRSDHNPASASSAAASASSAAASAASAAASASSAASAASPASAASSAPPASGQPEPDSQAPGQAPGSDATYALLRSIESRLNAIEQGTRQRERQSQFSSALSRLPEQVRKAYELLPLDRYSDEEFQSLVEKVGAESASIETGEQGRGGVFTPPPAGGAAAKASDAEMAALMERLG